MLLALAVGVAPLLAQVAGAGGGAAPWEHAAQFQPESLSPRAQFGFDVDVDGDTAVVGARFQVNDDGSKGAAYVFVLDATGSWVEQAVLTPEGATGSTGFGESVAVSGDTIVVGAEHQAHPVGFGQGVAYVFTRDAGGAWTQQALLLDPTPQYGWPGSGFGWAVTVDGDRVVVGAYRDDSAGVRGAGAAYAYERTGDEWALKQTIPSPIQELWQQFGMNLDLDGTTLLVGAEDMDQNEPDGGEAFVFVLNDDGDWELQARLDDPDTRSLDAFGWRVALHGDVAVVGDYWEGTPEADDAGAVHVFERNAAGEWPLTATLTAEYPWSWEFYGYDVSVRGDHILVGVPYGVLPDSDSNGYADLYERTADGWTRVQSFPDPDPDGYEFGSSVSFGDDFAVVGGLGDYYARSTGEAHVFRKVCEDGLATLAGTPAEGFLSATVHESVEPALEDARPSAGALAHQVNCQYVVAGEDVADDPPAPDRVLG